MLFAKRWNFSGRRWYIQEEIIVKLSKKIVAILLVLLLSALTKSWPTAASLNFSVITARLISATVNFTVNRKVVFNGNECLWKAVVKYAALAGVVLALNLALMHLLTIRLGWPFALSKILVEVLLFCMNFVVQGKFVYRKRG